MDKAQVSTVALLRLLEALVAMATTTAASKTSLALVALLVATPSAAHHHMIRIVISQLTVAAEAILAAVLAQIGTAGARQAWLRVGDEAW
jgi:hypothetical protein